MRVDPVTGRLVRTEAWPVAAAALVTAASLGVASPSADAAVTATALPYFPAPLKYVSITSDAADSIAVACVGGVVKVNGLDPINGPLACVDLGALATNGGAIGDTLDLSGVTPSSFPFYDAPSSTVMASTGADSIVGSAFGEFLDGHGGNDTISGGDGPDLISWVGASSIAGGNGDDVLSGDSGDSTVDGGAGRDRYSHFASSVGALDVVLTPAALSGDGTHVLVSVEEVSVRGSSAADRLDATAFEGGVLFEGLAGNDTLLGGTGLDTLVVENASGAVTLNAGQLVGPNAPIPIGTDAFTGVERASIRGNNLGDTIDAGAFPGSVTIRASSGADSITGTANGDLLDAGAGQDTVNAGGGVDTLASTTPGTSTLTATTLTVDATVDQLTSVEAALLEGGGAADRIDASGFAGPVTVVASGGADTIVGGASALDVLRVATTESAATLGAAQLVVGTSTTGFAAIERAELSSTSASPIPGSKRVAFDASGFAGPVTVTGGTGDDVLTGGAGDDLLLGIQGSDSLTGGPGSDTVSQTVAGDATLTPTSLSGLGSDSLASIERASLTGGAASQTFSLTGWLGQATVDAAGGGDVYAVAFAPAGIAQVTIQDSGLDGADALTVADCSGVLQAPGVVARGTQTVAHTGIESVACAPASTPPAPSAPPPPGPVETPARLATLGKLSFAKGAVRLAVRCVPEAQTACAGKVALATTVARRLVQATPRKVTVSLGTKRFSGVAPGSTRIVTVKLRKKALGLLGRAGSLKVKATVRVSDARGVERVETASATIRKPRAKPKPTKAR